jgi:hypothetical protein
VAPEGAQADRSPRPRCAGAGSTWRATTAQVRVFKHKAIVYACLRSSGNVFVLGRDDNVGSSSGGDIVGPVRVRGARIGYAITSGTQGTHWYSVASRDLRTGRFIHRFAVAPSAYYSASVDDLVLTSSGSLAWTVDLHLCTVQSCDEPPFTTYVVKDDASGVAILDAGSSPQSATWRVPARPSDGSTVARRVRTCSPSSEAPDPTPTARAA